MECCSEFCLFEEVGIVGSFLAYVGEGGPLLLGILGCCWSCLVLDGGLIRKALLYRMLWIMFSSSPDKTPHTSCITDL